MRSTKLSSRRDDDECVLAAGLFLALKTRGNAAFRDNAAQTALLSHPDLMNG